MPKNECRGHDPQEREDICGTCIWFNDKKGYGFLMSDEGRSCMVHYKNIKERGFKRLYSGQRVKYTEVSTDKGFLAINVKYERDFTYIKENEDMEYR